MTVSIPQSLVSFVIPSPERKDPEPVKTSLTQARADLERGDLREALRHLRRAADAADRAGSERRAVALARAAADLATEVGSSAAPPPVSPAASVRAPPASAARDSNEASAIALLLGAGRAVEVTVKRSTRDDALFVVRLPQGDAPGLGARRAVLVLLEPDEEFFARSSSG